MGIFSKKIETRVDYVAVFDKALSDAVANARKGGIGAGMLMSRLERAAEGLRWAAHHEAERRQSPAGNPVAVNEVWFQKEKARLIKAGEWPK